MLTRYFWSAHRASAFSCRVALISTRLSTPGRLLWLYVPWRAPVSHFSSVQIDEADRDGDGEVNEEEFLRIMKKTNLF